MASRAAPYRPGMPLCAWVLPAGSAWLLLSGCKDVGSSDQATRPLPAPEPPAAAAPPLLRERKSAGDAADTVVKPKRPSSDSEPAQTPGDASTAVGAAPTPAGADGTSGSVATDVGASPPAVAAPSAACVSRCQGAMQGCLSMPVDGGVPGFSNIELCKKAFEACQSTCKSG